MLLLEKKQDFSINAYFKSSNIFACEYIPSKKELLIIFSNGARYIYSEISASLYDMFKNAKSQGRFLNSHIKNRFEYKKIEPIFTDDLKAYINELVLNLKNDSTNNM